MENELPPDNLKSLWQNQRVEPVQMSLEEIRQKAEGFQNKIRRRNLREYVAGAFVFAAFPLFSVAIPNNAFRVRSHTGRRCVRAVPTSLKGSLQNRPGVIGPGHLP